MIRTEQSSKKQLGVSQLITLLSNVCEKKYLAWKIWNSRLKFQMKEQRLQKQTQLPDVLIVAEKLKGAYHSRQHELFLISLIICFMCH